MTRVDRRTFVAGSLAIVTTLVGCSGGNAGDGGSGGDNQTPQTIVDDAYDVSEDEYQAITFGTENAAELSLDAMVRSGPAIDVLVTSQAEFDSYQAGNNFRYDGSLSLLNTQSGTSTGELEAGDYALVIDNTNVAEAKPPSNLQDDVVTVEVTLTASRL